MKKEEKEAIKEKVLEDFKKSLENKDLESVIETFIKTSVKGTEEKERKEAKLWKLEL